ncbi:MAG: TraR/DksA family transcriptional regulator [Candidatus Acididesulfobacter diazotrophicus]|jgi:DnaK suppressor protein|uniref:TraR/DksA family transcriptional regulator n=1 Tax=Candidatus Acididesulfobacter diazotrophicus TaxID=2597226 RepID=A0A519BKK9_9DELT|nr:MAG: TraR/DksA family transcriptional regulator [Candidatus Acididesulfobacter diazotrophicus]
MTMGKIINKENKNIDIDGDADISSYEENHEENQHEDIVNSDGSDFTSEELIEIKQNLIKMRKSLLKEIDMSVKEGSSKDMSEPSGDIYDISSNERDRELSYMLGDRERNKIREIDNAISKIEDGTYGICDECGETISKKRLSVIPYSNLCIICKSNIEKEEKEKLNDSYSDNFNTIAILDEDTTYHHNEE